MAFNGTGTFNRIYNWVTDKANSIKILASRMDAEMDGFATGLSECITRDGQSPATGNLPMGGYQHTGAAAASAAGQYLEAQQLQEMFGVYIATTGAASAYVIAPTPAITSYVEGQTFLIKANHDSTGASTIDVSGLGATSINIGSTDAVVAGDIKSGYLYVVTYDGTNFILIRGGSAIGEDQISDTLINGYTDTTIATGDELLFGDVSDSNLMKKDTVQGIIDLIPVNPTGIVLPYAGASAPSGYLLCYGQTIGDVASGADVESADLETLFDLIKPAYGNAGTEVFANGDTVLLPDLRGRSVAGQDDMGGVSANRLTSPINGDTLGAAGGSEGHTLTSGEMPSHTHTGTTTSNGAHTHSTTASTTSGVANFMPGNGATNATPSTGSNGAHTHTFTTASSGSSGSHNNVQPTIVLNYIIKD